MTEKEKKNLETARKAIDAWNAHDPDRLMSLHADDYVSESDTLPAKVYGREGAGTVMRMYLSAFPDLRLEIEQMLASGDFVVTRWRATGTQKGELMGIAPTGRRAETHGCTVVEGKKGKITHEWLYWDTGHLMRQLGVMPAPPAAR